MSKGVFTFATLMIFHGGSANSNYPELNPELEMYQNITRVFPLTEAWYMAYRNYEDDPAFGTSKCVRFSQVGPEEEGRYPTMVEYGDGTQSANALMTLGSSEGYTAKNKLNYFPEGQEESLTLYLAYMDVGKCSVFRNVYVKEDACCVSVPKSLLGQSTIYCDFAYDLLCGTKKYNISDASCQNED
ncbi:uncharacterized protein LOC120840744 [Ixodes scapularis]|uniref:uncharacterized protein LOC120840744 n=1 Tax=Ixodes scapularis TaxID=6945 RepID=UPI001A9E4584|nr:uncharacterized protein LOC120840744 [Ixodes scapularis]